MNRARGAAYACTAGTFVLSFQGGVRPTAGFECVRSSVRFAPSLVVFGPDPSRDKGVC